MEYLKPPLPPGSVFAVLLLSGALVLRWRWGALSKQILAAQPGATCRAVVYNVLFKPLDWTGSAAVPIMAAFIALSVFAFLLGTCEELLSSYAWLQQLTDEIEGACTVAFTFEYGMRVWSIAESEKGRWMWCTRDIYGIIDLLSILPFYVQLLSCGTLHLPGFVWLRILRVFNLLGMSSYAVELETFGNLLWRQANKVLLVSGFLTGAIWLVCSAAYYYFDHENPEMVICPECEDVDDPSSCVGNLGSSCYNRMESIPSAMYFCLVNLFGEFPLMTKHTVGSRVVSVFIAFVGQVAMGIPCGLFGGAFQEYAEEADKKRKMSDVAPTSISKVARGYLTSVEIASVDGEANQRSLKILYGKYGETWEGHMGSVDAGELYKTVLFASVFGSALRLLTESLWLPSRVAAALYFLDLASVVLCFLDFRLRCRYAAREERPNGTRSYIFSRWGLLDLAAWSSQVVLQPVASGYGYPTVAAGIGSAAVAVKLLKLERFVGGFSVFTRLAQANQHVVITTGLVAMVLWVMCSAAMYISERENPNSEVRQYYTSIPAAMWLTLLNLTGECPLCDYSLTGKWITGVMGVLGVGFFTIPFGLLSGGFESYLEEYVVDRDESGPLLAARSSSLLVVQVPFDPVKHWILQLLCISPSKPSSRASLLFRRLAIAFTVLIVAQCMWRTVPAFITKGTAADQLDTSLEAAAMTFFTLEFLLRLFAAPSTPSLWSRRRYLLSLYGLVDVFTVVPYYLAQCRDSSWPELRHWAAVADAHDEELRLLRLLRLGLLDNYIPSLRVIRNVMRNPTVCRELAVASYVGATIWFIASSLLSFTERGNADDADQRRRFHTILSAMPYTLVHLTGDYPLIDYTLPGKLVHGIMLALMSGFVAVPAGIFANGFQNELQKEREEARRQSPQASPPARLSATGPGPAGGPVVARRGGGDFAKQERLLKILNRKAAHRLRVAIAFTSVASVLAATMPRFSTSMAVHIVHMAQALFFTLDYFLRLYASPADPSYNYSRRNFATSAVGVLDVVAVCPFWVEQALLAAGYYTDAHAEVFLLARLVTVLQLEIVTGGLALFSSTFKRCADTIVASGILALLIWLVSAVLFYEFEHDNELLEGAMESIPKALYFSAVFLADEWAVVDFTPAGQVLMVVICTSSLAIAALPVGCLFEAFVDAMQAEEDGEEEDAEEVDDKGTIAKKEP